MAPEKVVVLVPPAEIVRDWAPFNVLEKVTPAGFPDVVITEAPVRMAAPTKLMFGLPVPDVVMLLPMLIVLAVAVRLEIGAVPPMAPPRVTVPPVAVAEKVCPEVRSSMVLTKLTVAPAPPVTATLAFSPTPLLKVILPLLVREVPWSKIGNEPALAPAVPVKLTAALVPEIGRAHV